MSDLKPCPFCGGEARKEEEDDGGKFIECSTCSACTALHYDRAENLVSAWNRRWDAEGTLREMREALKTVMQHGRIDNSEARMNQVAAAITKAERAEP